MLLAGLQSEGQEGGQQVGLPYFVYLKRAGY